VGLYLPEHTQLVPRERIDQRPKPPTHALPGTEFVWPEAELLDELEPRVSRVDEPSMMSKALRHDLAVEVDVNTAVQPRKCEASDLVVDEATGPQVGGLTEEVENVLQDIIARGFESGDRACLRGGEGIDVDI